MGERSFRPLTHGAGAGTRVSRALGSVLLPRAESGGHATPVLCLPRCPHTVLRGRTFIRSFNTGVPRACSAWHRARTWGAGGWAQRTKPRSCLSFLGPRQQRTAAWQLLTRAMRRLPDPEAPSLTWRCGQGLGPREALPEHPSCLCWLLARPAMRQRRSALRLHPHTPTPLPRVPLLSDLAPCIGVRVHPKSRQISSRGPKFNSTRPQRLCPGKVKSRPQGSGLGRFLLGDTTEPSH